MLTPLNTLKWARNLGAQYSVIRKDPFVKGLVSRLISWEMAETLEGET